MGTRATQVALVLFSLLLATSCSTKTQQLFFDIQPPTAEELAEEARKEAAVAAAASEQVDTKSLFMGAVDDNQPRPDIESVTDWKQALEKLPRDYKKSVDWSAALEQGLIRPRTGADPRAAWATFFKYDFIMEAEKPKNEAYFPHSAHTEWLGCKNCHISLYPYRDNPPVKMKQMKKGASCGACHGKKKVAFPLKNCKRCHLKR